MSITPEKKPGGNYTEPDYDAWKDGVVKYNVFVGGIKIGTCDSDAEATYQLRKALEDNGRINVD